MDIPSMFKNTNDKLNKLKEKDNIGINNININNIAYKDDKINTDKLYDMLNNATNQTKTSCKNNTFLNLENTNISYIKHMLPLLGINITDNISKIIDIMEMKNLLTSYKKTYTKLDKKDIPSLKKETLLYLKPNLKDKSMVDMFIKIIEIGEIVNNRQERLYE